MKKATILLILIALTGCEEEERETTKSTAGIDAKEYSYTRNIQSGDFFLYKRIGSSILYEDGKQYTNTISQIVESTVINPKTTSPDGIEVLQRNDTYRQANGGFFDLRTHYVTADPANGYVYYGYREKKWIKEGPVTLFPSPIVTGQVTENFTIEDDTYYWTRTITGEIEDVYINGITYQCYTIKFSIEEDGISGERTYWYDPSVGIIRLLEDLIIYGLTNHTEQKILWLLEDTNVIGES